MIAPRTSTPRQDLAIAVLEHDPRDRGLIATRLFPMLSALTREGSYSKITAANFAVDPGNIKRASRASAVRGRIKVEEGTYACERYTYESEYDDDELRRYRSQFDVDAAHALHVRATLEMELERDVASLVFNTSNFPLSGDTGGNVTTEWSTAATATPRADVHSFWADKLYNKSGGTLRKCGIAMCEENARNVMNCADFRNFMAYGFRPVAGDVDEALLRDYFGLGEVLIARSARNTAGVGATATFENPWDDEYAFMYVIADAGQVVMGPSVGRVISFQEGAEPLAFDTYREESRTANIVRGEGYWDAVLMSTAHGVLMGNISA